MASGRWIVARQIALGAALARLACAMLLIAPTVAGAHGSAVASRMGPRRPTAWQVERWGEQIREASSRFDIPEDWIRQIMRAESGGRTSIDGRPVTSSAGGMHFYPPWVLAEMRRICDVHDVLLIADEVMTGWGRTGKLIASEWANIVPDILCLSKGLTGGALPLAVTMASERIYEAHFSTDRSKMFFHSSSYTANPVACAAASANIAIWLEESVLDRVSALARLQEAAIGRLSSHRSVHNARRCGTITAFEVGGSDGRYLSSMGPTIYRTCLERGVLLRPLGNTLYVMPPYCTSKGELDMVYDAAFEAIEMCAG